MGLAELTVALSTSVRVQHCGACLCGCECACTPIHSVRCRSTAEWLRVGVWGAAYLQRCRSRPTLYFAQSTLPGGALSNAPNSRPPQVLQRTSLSDGLTDSEFITLIEKVLKRPSHTLVPGRRNSWRDVKNKRTSSRDLSVVQDSHSEREREKKFFPSMEIFAISLKCELNKLLEEEELLQKLNKTV